MKFIFFVLLFSFIANTAFIANPFASKNKVVKHLTKVQALDELIYKGYAFVGDIRIAIVQFKNTQYTLSVGDLIEKGIVTEIKRTHIKYKLNNQEFKVSIENDEE